MEESFDRLAKYLKYKGLSDNYVTNLCGLSTGLLSRVRNGKNGLSSSTVEKLLRNLTDLNGEWLLTGDGPMLKDAPLVNQTNVHGQNTANVNTQSMEVSELQAKLREKEIEITYLQNQLQEANMWTQRLWSYIFGTKTDSKTDSKKDKENANN